jgi:hypothetical protein
MKQLILTYFSVGSHRKNLAVPKGKLNVFWIRMLCKNNWSIIFADEQDLVARIF